MSKQYPEGTHWIVAGYSNDLKLDAILNLTPQMKQVVTIQTRFNPPRMLDPILTTLLKYYQAPVGQKPLDADEGTGGATSDHICIKFTPVTVANTIPARQKRRVTVRPMS